MPAPNHRQRQREAQQARARAARRRRLLIICAAALVVVVATVLAVVVTQGRPQPAPSAPAELAYPPNATAERDGIVLNDNAGKPEVGLYFDYQCAHCVGFENSFAGALALLGQTGEIRLVHHPRVFLDRGDQQGRSHRAAQAAACADVVGAYQGYHEAIFAAAPQGPYTEQLFLQSIPERLGITGTDLTAFRACYANQNLAAFVQGVDDAAAPQGPYTEQLFLESIPERLGMTGADLTAFRACYANQNLAAFVQGVDDAAGRAGINDTPTLTVNGKPVPAATFQGKTGADLKAIIDAAAKG